MLSIRDKSDPLGPSAVRIERHRRPVGALATFQRKLAPSPRNPPTDNGYSVIHNKGSGADSPVPIMLVRGSMSSILTRTADPRASSPSDCHAIVDAREMSSTLEPNKDG